MKTKLLLISALIFVLIVAGFAIFIKNQKDQIAKKIQEQKQLEQQRTTEAQKQLEAQEENQRQIEAQKEQQIEADKEQAETKRSQIINDDFDKIKVRLDRLSEEPTGFASKNTKEEREGEEQRLKQLANSVKSEIGDIIIDLKNAGFRKDDELEEKVNDFIDDYDSRISYERLTDECIESGLNDLRQQMQSKQDNASMEIAKDRMAIIFLKYGVSPSLQAEQIGSNPKATESKAEDLSSQIADLVKAGDMAGAKKIVDSIQDETLKKRVQEYVAQKLKQ